MEWLQNRIKVYFSRVVGSTWHEGRLRKHIESYPGTSGSVLVLIVSNSSHFEWEELTSSGQVLWENYEKIVLWEKPWSWLHQFCNILLMRFTHMAIFRYRGSVKCNHRLYDNMLQEYGKSRFGRALVCHVVHSSVIVELNFEFLFRLVHNSQIYLS